MDEVHGIRLLEFRQLKREIRGSRQHLIVGIDVAKERHNAFFGTATGRTVHKGLVFDNTIEGFQKLLALTEALKVQYVLTQVVFGLEPTANYHKPLGEHLIKCGHTVVLVSATAVKNNRSLLDGRWDKHDTKDSANVADLISQGKCLYYDYPDPRIRDLRGLLALKRRLKKEEHSLRVRIRNQLLAQYFPEMDRLFRCATSLAVIGRCLNPSMIAGMEFDEFRRRVVPGRLDMPQQKQLSAIWRMAPESIGCHAGDAVPFEGQVMASKLHQVRETIKAVEDKIEDLCSQFPEYQCLLSIPGFGPDVSSKVLGAIGWAFRFVTCKQVLKMAGFDLCAERSGKTSNSATPVISKQGKADLRYALYQAALIASLRNKGFMCYYTNKLRDRQREKGIGTKMRVKLAAKLLVIAWTLMKKKELFDPSYLTKGDVKAQVGSK
ncbi:MAG: IS110 family transposase [Nitrospirae bacterium]|nr:IS110 family transposase [Nitrospirota bacterium]